MRSLPNKVLIGCASPSFVSNPHRIPTPNAQHTSLRPILFYSRFCKHGFCNLNQRTNGDLEKDDEPEIYHGEPLVERKSKFMAHLAFVNSVDQVNSVFKR